MQAVEPFNEHLGFTITECLNQFHRLCHKITHKFRHSHIRDYVDYDDLFQVSVIGLIKAYNKYDPTQFDGQVNKFSTYAVPKIEGELLRFQRDFNPGVKYSRLTKVGANFIHKHNLLGKSSEEILEQMHALSNQFEFFSFSDVEKSIDCARNLKPVYGDEQKQMNDNEKLTVFDKIPSHDDLSSIVVQDFLDWLPSNLSQILSMRLQDQTQTQIADQLGVSQVQISRRLQEIQVAYHRYNGGQKKMARISKKNQQKAIRYLSETSKSYQEISKETGYSVSTVAEMAKTYRPKEIRQSLSKQRIKDAVTSMKNEGSLESTNKEINKPLKKDLKEEKNLVVKEPINVEKNKEIKEYGLLFPKVDEAEAAKEEVMKVSESGMNVESTAPKTSRISRSFSFQYASSGEELSRALVVQELENMIAMIKDSQRDEISFDLLVKS